MTRRLTARPQTRGIHREVTPSSGTTSAPQTAASRRIPCGGGQRVGITACCSAWPWHSGFLCCCFGAPPSRWLTRSSFLIGPTHSPVPGNATQADGDPSSAAELCIPRTSQGAARSPLLGPDRGRMRPRKPPMPRRASSNAQAPHRGEIFSVDDGIAEVEADAAERHQSYTATVRRRAVAAPALSRVHSSHGEEAVTEHPDEQTDQADAAPVDVGDGNAGGGQLP